MYLQRVKTFPFVTIRVKQFNTNTKELHNRKTPILSQITFTDIFLLPPTPIPSPLLSVFGSSTLSLSRHVYLVSFNLEHSFTLLLSLYWHSVFEASKPDALQNAPRSRFVCLFPHGQVTHCLVRILTSQVMHLIRENMLAHNHNH